MRILIVSQHYWPSLGGAEVMLGRLARTWQQLGHTVTVWTCRWPEHRQLSLVRHENGILVYRQPYLPIRGLGSLWYGLELNARLMGSCCQPRPAFDVVYVSMLKHAAAGILWRPPPVPVVLRAEGAGASGDMAFQANARGGWLIRRLCRRANAWVAPSQPIADEMRQAGYDAQRLHLIPNGVPVPTKSWSLDEVAAFQQQLGFAPQRTVCFTGRLHPGKGLTDLLVALSRCQQRGQPLRLLLVGTGPAESELQQKTQQLGLSALVQFCGQVADVEPYLRASHLYVLPSYFEGLSLSLLEALMIGMPVLASDIPANQMALSAAWHITFPTHQPEQLANLIEATFLRLEQTPATFHKDLQQRRQVTQARFSLAAVAQQHLQLFAQLRKEY